MSNNDSNNRRKGRRNGLEAARDLMGLLGSLSHEGSTISEDVVAKRLGVPQEQARQLMEALETVGIELDAPLSLYSQENGQLSVAFERGIHGKPIRLTNTETVALNAALNYLHVPEDDSLRAKLNRAYGTPDVDYVAVMHAIMPSDSPAIRNTLKTISTALVQGTRIRFEYKGINDGALRPRSVLPSRVRRSDTSWFLDGLDTVLDEPRTFRVDRIHACTIAHNTASEQASEHSSPTDSHTDSKDNASYYERQVGTQLSEDRPRSVMLRINDTTVLRDFKWPGLHIMENDTRRSDNTDYITATIPYYGAKSPWLPRQLAACGNRVTCADDEVSALKQEYIRNQLSSAQSS